MAERSRALDSLVLVLSECGFESNPGLVSFSKTLNNNCFVLRMGRKAVGPVCCVMHVTEHRTPLQNVPWFFYRIPTGFPRDFHGISTGFPRDFHRDSHRIPIGYRYWHGVPMGFAWVPMGY